MGLAAEVPEPQTQKDGAMQTDPGKSHDVEPRTPRKQPGKNKGGDSVSTPDGKVQQPRKRVKESRPVPFGQPEKQDSVLKKAGKRPRGSKEECELAGVLDTEDQKRKSKKALPDDDLRVSDDPNDHEDCSCIVRRLMDFESTRKYEPEGLNHEKLGVGSMYFFDFLFIFRLYHIKSHYLTELAILQDPTKITRRAHTRPEQRKSKAMSDIKLAGARQFFWKLGMTWPKFQSIHKRTALLILIGPCWHLVIGFVRPQKCPVLKDVVMSKMPWSWFGQKS